MIFVDRNSVDSSGNVIRPNDDWFKKAKEATDLALNEKENHSPKDDIFGHIQVRIALEKLFEFKCAYCENNLEESGWNVEHYRPKGRIAERQDHPGYYWLTYDWNNLFPSCIPCNQRRKDLPTWEDNTFGLTGGKADHFPIVDENLRAMKPGNSIVNENPILINPCQDDPESYFTYDVLGEILALNDEEKASKSIEIFNLKRKRIKRKRKIIIEVAIEFVKTIEELKRNGNTAYKRIEDLFEKQCLAKSCLFAASARCVKKYPTHFGIN